MTKKTTTLPNRRVMVGIGYSARIAFIWTPILLPIELAGST